MIPRWRYPHVLIKGTDTDLTLDVYTAAGVQQTASSGTFTLYRGATAIVDEEALTSAGPPASYTVTAATTSSIDLDDREKWRAVWVLTIGGTAYTFTRPVFFAQYPVHLQIIPQDLYDMEDSLREMLGTTFTSFEPMISNAWLWILGHLCSKNVRPHLVTSSGDLVPPTIYATLEQAFRQAHGSTGSDVYLTKADAYAAKLADALEALVLGYDSDEDGAEDTHKTSLPATMPRERSRDW